eukprot:TRINITY_DN96241_c0_g1_i1.p1 TRINITY_DN96241_c0_g1~~TRINITY_DN96241_c0_g1_i1.p1  ORF type:complete len:397 (+),score=86.13 TRINITY_DN96241_c0_g1_i1:34-1224(+)
MGLLEALSDGRRLRRAAQTQQPQQPTASPPAAAAGLSLLERLGDDRQQRRRAGVEARQAVKETQWQSTTDAQQAVGPPPGLERSAWPTPSPASQSSACAPAMASSGEASQPQRAHMSQSTHIASAQADTSSTSCINGRCDNPAEATCSSYPGNSHRPGTHNTYAQASVSSNAAVASSSHDAFAAASCSAAQSPTAAAFGTQDALSAKPPTRPEQGQGCQETMGRSQPTEEIFSSLPPTAETHGASVEAIAPFQASTEFELSLAVGDQLVLTHANVRGYFGGQNMETKERGWFPERCVAMAPKSKRRERAPEMAPEPAQDLLDQGGKEKTQQEEQGWEKYQDADRSDRFWYWNRVSEEWFYEDESMKKGWSKYRISEDSKKHWFLHEASGRYFTEKE